MSCVLRCFLLQNDCVQRMEGCAPLPEPLHEETRKNTDFADVVPSMNSENMTI